MLFSRQSLLVAATAAAVGVAMLLMGSTAPGPTVIFVDDDNCPGPGSGIQADPYCSIQTAIDNAVDLDEIVVAPGTYNEVIDFLGKAITVRSSGGAAVTTITGTGLFGSVVSCTSGEGPSTVLEGFTITGGRGTICGFFSTCGGGMFNLGSSPTVIACIFIGNSASGSGGAGGVGLGGGMFNNGSTPTVTNCTFTGNSAEFGGGMYNGFSSPTVTNCTFTENSAVKSGGAVPGRGGGMSNGGGSPTVINCVLWDNFPDQISSTPETTVSFSDVQGGWPGIGNIDANPLFVDLGNGDLRLSSGSPCIDAADNTAVPEDITTDLDGKPRFVDDPDTPDTGNGEPPIVDMGAYEFQLPCPWDLNGDGVVSVPDLLLLLGDFGSCAGSPADFDGDGCVTVVDLLALIANFGPCPGSECVWDVNGDGFVDNDDLQQVLGNQGPCDGCPEDVNGDGIVNGQDAAAVSTHFGPCQ